MIPTPKPDRVKASPGGSFRAMREKARSGKLAGKKYAGEYLSGTTTAQSVSGKVAKPAEVIGRHFAAKTPMTGHDPKVVQHSVDKPPAF